eukprot:6186332-Amphidinium_carterae.1
MVEGLPQICVRKFRYYEDEAMDTDASLYGIGGVLLDADSNRPTEAWTLPGSRVRVALRGIA